MTPYAPRSSLKTGRLGVLRVGFYVATMDENLAVTFPEHSGYQRGKTVVSAVSYSPKMKAAIRKQMQRDFLLLASIPNNRVDPAILARLQN